jgi:hypothetical protein
MVGILIVMTVLVVTTGIDRSMAESYNALGLDDRTYFDIYIGGYNDEGSIIRNVKISGLKEIAGENFLIIQTQFLDAKRYEGLVAFRHIRAILPTSSTVVESKFTTMNSGYKN